MAVRAPTRGPRRETQGQGAVGPPPAVAAISRLACTPARQRSPRRRNPLKEPMLTRPGRARTGGGLCRPVSAPAQVSQQGRGVSDPARALCTRPQSRPAGSLTPHVSVGDVLGRACCAVGICPRIRTNVSAEFLQENCNCFASAAVPAGVAFNFPGVIASWFRSLRFPFSGSAWARQGSASPLRALDPPGALPMLCNYRSDGTSGSIPGWLTTFPDESINRVGYRLARANTLADTPSVAL